MRKYIFTLVVVWGVFTQLTQSAFAIDKALLRQFTGLAIGDTINIPIPDAHSQGYFLLFADIYSCSVCMIAANELYRSLPQGDSMKFVLFIGGATDADMKDLRERYGREQTIIADPIGAYRKYYQVHQYPFYILTSASGRILLMDKAGGGNVSTEELQQAMSAIKTSSIPQHSRTIKLKRKISIEHDDAQLFTRFRISLFSPKTGSLIVVAHTANLLYIIDSVGNIKKKIDVNGLSKPRSLATFMPTWIKEDSVLLLVDTRIDVYRAMYTVNINTGETREIPFQSQFLDSNLLGIAHALHYMPHKDKILMSLTRMNDHKLAESDYSFLLYDVATGKSSFCGTPDRPFIDFNLSLYHGTRFQTDTNSLIYEKQGISRTVNVYTPDGKRIRSFQCNVDTTCWRDLREDCIEPQTGTLVEKHRQYAKKSNIEYLFIDSTQDKLSVVYYTMDYPDSTDFTRYTMNFFIHRTDTTGNRLLTNDIRLPNNTIPFYADDTSVGATEFIDNRLFIVWYDILKE